MEDEQGRVLPSSDLDLNLMLTDSVWGRDEVPTDLKEKLSVYSNGGQDAEGQTIVTKSSLWGVLGFLTRDMRLGNLSEWNNEIQTCRYHIDLANDLLDADMTEPFIIALERAANILETSQSKGGFLRKQMNTLRQEHMTQNLEPPKKSLFGGKRDNQQGGY